MEKGKLGIRLSFYAVAAFILAFLGYSTVLALLAGFVLIVEKNEWASRQVIQAFFLCIFANIVDGILGIFDFLYQIPLMGSVWGTAISVIDGIVSLVVLIFCIMALVNTAKGNEANVPGLNGLANWTASLKRIIRNVRNAGFQREHISMEMPEAWQMQRKRQSTSFHCLRERDTSTRSFMTWKAA